jgi:O-antigen ligase
MKLQRVALYNRLFAIAVASNAYAFALTGGNFAVLVPFLAIVLLMPGLSCLTPGYGRFDRGNLLRWATISTVLFLTVLANITNYPFAGTTVIFAVTHAVGIVGILFALQWAATNLSPEYLLRYLAICLLPLLILAIIVALHDGGWLLRASPFGVHPNWWGEVGFAAVASSLALRSLSARVIVIGAALILFFLVQSRGALLAAATSIVVCVFFSMRQSDMTRRHFQTGLLVLPLVVVALILGRSALPPTWDLLSNTVLLLGDPDRGVDTELTGRIAGWRAAIEVAANNPVFGQGLDTLDTVHNGFLQLAGEGGASLFLVILVTIALAIHNAWYKRNCVALSIIVGYLVYAMTYPRMLNMNVASILFYLCLFSWRKTSKIQGARRRPVDRAAAQTSPN